MRPYLLTMILGACSAPPDAPSGVPEQEPVHNPAPPEAAQPSAPVAPADRPPTAEEIAAASRPEPPPSEADLVAAQDLPPEDPAPAPPPPNDADVTNASAWTDSPAIPPYSGWTRADGLPLLGLGGDTLMVLPRAGIRVEVLAQDDDRLSIQCIGCPAPWSNAGGWLPADAVLPMMRTVDPGSPLAALLPARIAWGRSQESVPAGLDRDALCRVADQGYTVDGDTATWEAADGGASLAARRGPDGWRLDTSGGPSAAAGAWRCPLTPPAG